LGDTVAQSKQLYGEPIKPVETPAKDCQIATFVKNDFKIVASFLRDKCVQLEIEKLDTSNPTFRELLFSVPMTSEEAQAILDQNIVGVPWTMGKEIFDPGGDLDKTVIPWTSSKDEYGAILMVGLQILQISDTTGKTDFDSAVAASEHEKNAEAAGKVTQGL
jgi:hypothetical protein